MIVLVDRGGVSNAIDEDNDELGTCEKQNKLFVKDFIFCAKGCGVGGRGGGTNDFWTDCEILKYGTM